MDRYSIIDKKFKREIVLLKSYPCAWGKCSFCDYIEDNTEDPRQMIDVNIDVLSNIDGRYKRLEVINSGSVFEIDKETLNLIKKISDELSIKDLVFEAHWMYRNRLDEIRDFFPNQSIFFKTGIETFDDDFRNKILKKGIIYDDLSEVYTKFDSVCLMVGIKGQTKDMIRRDIELALKYFKRATINVFNNNSTDIKRDEELVRWFLEEFSNLEDESKVEVLVNITDFGVGEL